MARSTSPAAILGLIAGGCLLGLVITAVVFGVQIAMSFGIVWAHNQLAATQWPYDWQHVGAIFVIILVISMVINAGRKSK